MEYQQPTVAATAFFSISFVLYGYCCCASHIWWKGNQWWNPHKNSKWCDDWWYIHIHHHSFTFNCEFAICAYATKGTSLGYRLKRMPMLYAYAHNEQVDNHCERNPRSKRIIFCQSLAKVARPNSKLQTMSIRSERMHALNCVQQSVLNFQTRNKHRTIPIDDASDPKQQYQCGIL